MIAEIILCHGTRVFIDGKRSTEKWCYGVPNGNTIIPQDLQIGPHKIHKITIHGKQTGGEIDYIIWDEIMTPEEVEITTDDAVYRGPVTVVATNPNAEEDGSIIMHNGKTLELDEVTLYMKAELEKIEY